MKPATQPDVGVRVGFWRTLWQRDGKAMLAALLGTLAVELGVYAAAIRGDIAPADAVLATLAMMTLICAIMPPALAAGGRGAWSALLRGGVVVDATGLALLILLAIGPAGQGGPALTFWGVCKAYLVFAAVTLTGVAAVCLSARPVGRCIAAVLAATAFGLALASPIWISAWIGTGLERPAQEQAAELAVWINPFYAAAQAGYAGRPFIWHEWRAMYRWTRLGEYVSPPPVSWVSTAGLYAALAAAMGAMGAGLSYWRGRRGLTEVPAAGLQTAERPGRDD
jgi:hypothetical protein